MSHARIHSGVFIAFVAAATVLTAAVGAQSAPPASSAATAAGPQKFDTAEKAAGVLVDAAEKFDVPALHLIFASDGDDLVLTGELAQDRERAQAFAAQARKQMRVVVDPKTGARAYLLVGTQDWPFPIPIVKLADKWSFDASEGRLELMYRRIGSNELDAIAICKAFVAAQFEYAYRPHKGYAIPQYAQRILSTAGKQDGLAWKNSDGSWGGPIGQEVAHAIEQGYNLKAAPYHGYFFKVLHGQGPAAPLGAMNYVVKGAMIGGFALVAAPAEYGETGVKTFMVSNTGIVYEKDAGPDALAEFQKMDRFNPDASWTAVSAADQQN